MVIMNTYRKQYRLNKARSTASERGLYRLDDAWHSPAVFNKELKIWTPGPCNRRY